MSVLSLIWCICPFPVKIWQVRDTFRTNTYHFSFAAVCKLRNCPPSLWTAWSTWSNCTSTEVCGHGISTRERICQQRGENPCPGSGMAMKECRVNCKSIKHKRTRISVKSITMGSSRHKEINETTFVSMVVLAMLLSVIVFLAPLVWIFRAHFAKCVMFLSDFIYETKQQSRGKKST